MRMGSKAPEPSADEIVERYRRGAKIKELARRHGASRVYRALGERGVEIRRSPYSPVRKLFRLSPASKTVACTCPRRLKLEPGAYEAEVAGGEIRLLRKVDSVVRITKGPRGETLLVVPRELKSALGWREGDEVVFEESEGKVVVGLLEDASK